MRIPQKTALGRNDMVPMQESTCGTLTTLVDLEGESNDGL